MQRAITELAYLRDGLTRGIIDETGRIREKHLLAKIRSIRGKAIIEPEGRAAYPSLRRRRAGAFTAYPPPSYPGPAGLGGNYPAPSAFPAPTGLPQRGRGFGALGQAAATQYRGRSQLETARRVGSRGWPAGSLTPLESALAELRAAVAQVSPRYRCRSRGAAQGRR